MVSYAALLWKWLTNIRSKQNPNQKKIASSKAIWHNLTTGALQWDYGTKHAFHGQINHSVSILCLSQLSQCWRKLTQNKLILMSMIQINNVNRAPECKIKWLHINKRVIKLSQHSAPPMINLYWSEISNFINNTFNTLKRQEPSPNKMFS